MTLAQTNRDEAINRADEHAHEEWKDVVDRCFRWVAQYHRTFTSDDVWEAMDRHYPDVTTHEHRAIGAAVRRAIRDGIMRLQTCQFCGTSKVMVSSRRPQANCSDTTVYESLIYGHRGQQ